MAKTSYAPAVLKIPAPPFRKGRPKVKPPAAPPTPPLLPLGIVSVSGASFHAGSGQVVVTFDVNSGYELEEPVGANPAQWSVVFNHMLYRGIDFDFEGGSSLTIYVEQYITSTKSNSISYAADPSDIGDTQGRMLGEVDSFPI